MRRPAGQQPSRELSDEAPAELQEPAARTLLQPLVHSAEPQHALLQSTTAEPHGEIGQRIETQRQQSSLMQPPRPEQPARVKSQQPTHPMREPDEIQIQIGRIEVTAVPPASQPRPAARPAPKSLDLGAYLKRGRSSR